MKLVIGISTMNDGVFSLLSKVSILKENFDIIVCHQITNENVYTYPEEMGGNIKVIPKFEKGLSKSRNVLLYAAIEESADYIIISDEDVKYEIDNLLVFKETLISSAAMNSHYQFKSITSDGKDRKRYSINKYELGFLDIFKVSSIEMCLNIALLKKDGILFDENFGLGAYYPVGEEAVLLADIVKRKQKITFIPIAITIHPIESTGLQLFTQPLMVISRGAMFKRCFGLYLGSVMMAMFWLKKFALRKRNAGDISSVNAIKLLIKGFK